MKKEFVPYDRSLRLKALGFDEPCFGYYDGNYNFQFMYNGIPEKFTEKKMGVSDSVWVGWISAPTFTQTFRLFREKYGMYSHIKTSGKISVLEFTWVSNGKYGFFSKDGFKTYEEAELACLDNLLEIVEQK